MILHAASAVERTRRLCQVNERCFLVVFLVGFFVCRESAVGPYGMPVCQWLVSSGICVQRNDIMLE